jgi:hypothetical protein
MNVSELLNLIATDPQAAADQLEAAADKLKLMAESLRSQGSIRSVGGMGDVVHMKLVGPDGQVKHEVTNGN